MNNTEAIKVLGICLEADHGCSYCAKDLVERFILIFPEHKDLGESALKFVESDKFGRVSWKGHDHE